MTEEHLNEIKAIVILAIGMIFLASLISFVPEDLPWYTSNPNVPVKNLIKITGAYTAGSLLFVFGYSAYFMVFFLFFWSSNLFAGKEISFSLPKFISFIVLICVISSLFGMIGPKDATLRFENAGFIGLLISDFMMSYLGAIGGFIVLAALGVLALILTGEFLITPLFLRLVELSQGVSAWAKESFNKKRIVVPEMKMPNINFNLPKKGSSPKKKPIKDEEEEEYEDDEEYDEDEEEEYEDDEEYEDEEDEDEEYEEDEDGSGPKVKIAPTDKPKRKKKNKPVVVGDYEIPTFDLLEDSPEISTDKLESDLISGAKKLEQTLASFNVEARVADIERGPAITRYELQPAPGVKVQKFTTLSDDIALAMEASTVRIVAPIPGKSRVGIEVPNASSASVFLKDVLQSDEFQNNKSKLTLALGKDIAGKAITADLAEMPHLLIAGTTGSGKTICVNSIIMSILFNATPQEVRFVMVDPKMVELAQYNDIPHLLCPTVTDPKKAANVLNWVVGEMESRYKKLSKAGARNIKSYTAKGHDMPYIVVIIDELADLMQVSAKTVEGSIARLAQLSRAVGIHLILATQRPSVNVITGVIKANFPARISFKVASKVDSRTVLDMNGAESLLGKGDMLIMQTGDARPTRAQGNFVTDEEIHRVINFIKDQQQPVYDESIIEQQTASAVGGTMEKDEYYDDAVKLIIESNQASVSILQRRMRLGYTRAARLIDMMEQNGVVGPYVGSKPREIMVDREQWMLDNAQTDAGEEEE